MQTNTTHWIRDKRSYNLNYIHGKHLYRPRHHRLHALNNCATLLTSDACDRFFERRAVNCFPEINR